MRSFSDEELTAYLDGEADATLSGAIDAASGEPALRERLDALSVDKAALKQSFDAALDNAPAMPTGLGGQVRPGNPMRQISAYAAAAVIFFMLGVGATQVLTPGESVASWREYAAAYHKLYVNETLMNVASTDGQLEAELIRASKALGRELDRASLDQDGLSYKRAQILGFSSKPLIQLAYLSETGVPIALCILRDGAAKDQGVTMAEMHDMNVASWNEGGYQYLLVGDVDAAFLQQSAAALARRL